MTGKYETLFRTINGRMNVGVQKDRLHMVIPVNLL
jgi:hypothetical protein